MQKVQVLGFSWCEGSQAQECIFADPSMKRAHVCVGPSENNIWFYPHATHLQPVQPWGPASRYLWSTFHYFLQCKLHLIINSCPSTGEGIIGLWFFPKTLLWLWNTRWPTWKDHCGKKKCFVLIKELILIEPNILGNCRMKMGQHFDSFLYLSGYKVTPVK